MNPKYAEIAALLSLAIVSELRCLRAEQTHPGRNSDESDDFITSQQKKIDKLLDIRLDVEFIAAGYTGTPRAPEVRGITGVALGGLSDLLDLMDKIEKKTAPPGPVPPENKAQAAAAAAAASTGATAFGAGVAPAASTGATE